MSPIYWAVLIALALIAIAIGLALILYFCFWSNDGASPGFGVFLAVVAALLLAAIYPAYSSSEIVPATIIAGSFLVVVFGALINYLLPNFDNKDVVLAARPVLLITVALGLVLAFYSIIKVIVT